MRVVQLRYRIMLTCMDPAYPWQGYAKGGLSWDDRTLADTAKRAIERVNNGTVIADVEEVEIEPEEDEA